MRQLNNIIVSYTFENGEKVLFDMIRLAGIEEVLKSIGYYFETNENKIVELSEKDISKFFLDQF